MNIDIELLRRQILFLLEYPWREGDMPEEVDGILHLLESVLDMAGGYESVSS
jgi:hypothetical protein